MANLKVFADKKPERQTDGSKLYALNLSMRGHKNISINFNLLSLQQWSMERWLNPLPNPKFFTLPT